MSNEITMPKLSDTMEEGKILHWLKRPGDEVHRGDAIAEVETDKADMVLEAFDEGVLDELTLKEGESAPVGAVIAMLRQPGEAPAKRVKPAKPAEAEEATAEAEEAPAEGEPGEVHPAMGIHPSAAPTAVPAPPRARLKVVEMPEAEEEMPLDGHKVRASPLARRAAEEAGIEIEHVRGTGPDGRVTKRDIDNYLREQQMFKFRRLVHPHEGAPGSREEMSKMRKTIAQRMALSKREIPHFYVTVEVDMEEAVRLKKSLETTEIFETDISYNDMIVKATALA